MVTRKKKQALNQLRLYLVDSLIPIVLNVTRYPSYLVKRKWTQLYMSRLVVVVTVEVLDIQFSQCLASQYTSIIRPTQIPAGFIFVPRIRCASKIFP